ncbi:hypothetical protein ERD78_18750 [Allopusillimonas soli]|uniref:Chromosome partitioning protein ParB n=1 Tax=Allopusillimonas soli TaxID=659016 RepID=A0A853FFN9_9BURK|nr:hypothetical protein [Allopusillimonas soli]NYT38893.1 hypothetical protein [Allopusillimonas soli]TEA70108.1 hypothetical protein ERD78_18750 [Allopusillimonas soli]
MMAPLISSQRHLDQRLVRKKAATFRTFIVRTLDVELRGRCYRILLDGHHNLAAARMAAVEPTWRGPAAKFQRIMRKTPPPVLAAMLINNLTDSDWYYIDTGEVVTELLHPERIAE